MKNIRPAAVAGLFYPANAVALTEMIDQQLSHVSSSQSHTPKALIVPHAGYIYSGEIAASAYHSILPLRETITRVVLIGPSHRVGFYGLALSSADYFSTPLGDIPLDKSCQQTLAIIDGVQVLDQAHSAEHSLEVQLPFLQSVLDAFTLVPIVAGDASPELVAKVIETLWGGDETLIVISSDLSHYHDYQTAKKLDNATSKAIVAANVDAIHPHNACGCVGIRGLLAFTHHHPMTISILDLRNSGDTAGSKDSVVGYGAYLLEEVA